MNEMPLISDIPAVQSHYEYCRLVEGTSHTLAEMFAWQIAPGCMTDNVFNQSRNGDQWGKNQGWIGDKYAETARAAGVSITGATYLHGLAAYPGDPKAWVRSRGDVQRVCEERGWGCHGAVNIKAPEPMEDPALHPKRNIAVADDIISAATQKALEAHPELAFGDQGELRHEVTEKLRPQWTRPKTPKKQLDFAA